LPITKSAKKALRRDKRKAKINKPIRLKVRDSIKKMRQSPTNKNLKSAYSSLDKAAKKKIVHKNKANRLKSRLSKLLKK